MVKKLRMKFVYVTTILMIAVFGVFFTANYWLEQHWNLIDIASMLEWISESNLFLGGTSDEEQEYILEELEEERTIAGIIVSREGKIVQEHYIGKKGKLNIPDVILGKMLEQGKDSYKIKTYIYSYRILDDGNILLVVMNTAYNYKDLNRLFWNLGLIIMGICILVLIIFYLSRFVTEPAEQALLREKRFISDAGHELKTPLGAISINAQALELQGNDNIYLRNILHESERMKRLIEKLLTLSKLDENEIVEKSELNLSDIVMEMALTYESISFEEMIDYNYQIEDHIYLYANADEIRQVMAIMIDNAIKHTDQNGQINIICKKEGKRIFIEVKNTGKGIEDKDLEHIFERFYTSNPSRNHNSFGLGLAIAKTIAERNSGRISAESQPGKETKFILEFGSR